MEGYLLSMGVKRAAAAFVGYIVGLLGCSWFIHALAVLKVAGITVLIDEPVFEKWLGGTVGVALVMVHDWLKVKKPEWKWL